jgi:hypothetical protein
VKEKKEEGREREREREKAEFSDLVQSNMLT